MAYRIYYKKNWITYQQYLKTDYWKKKSLSYKQKFPICECCRKHKSEHVHHQTYVNLKKEKYWDLLALCASCHRKKHNIT